VVARIRVDQRVAHAVVGAGRVVPVVPGRAVVLVVGRLVPLVLRRDDPRGVRFADDVLQVLGVVLVDAVEEVRAVLGGRRGLRAGGLGRAGSASWSILVWYSPTVSVAATALRNAAYWPAVTSYVPMAYGYATSP
jgi:hypothetical protein